LGKTIEACLILHRLHLCGRASRVLILLPDALVNQWFVELYRRHLQVGPGEALRQCVRAYFVARELPAGTLERLVLSHLNLLSQLDDGPNRRLLAQATVDNGWSGLDLRAAILGLLGLLFGCVGSIFDMPGLHSPESLAKRRARAIEQKN
jgi:hypothetical protein